ncbi:DUF4435 domain-containing protein [Alcanivorax sp. VBW004]|uniref:DUF4435 domain-containing protein n=1 Tax=Alcanivorax sp. VBW004 TaxID=1287708 RepID=UPI0012BBD114|nr:DUF4435 domain-containing protein [Alcanivorax sp. VBW004]MTT53746.1 DUF4435 domain-containing protein [Alcanivorax sp. VBW004]
MGVRYDINQYIASVKMSNKTRILVEGRDDQSNLRNLILSVVGEKSLRVDSAEIIKGDCKKTSRNNREKIEKVHGICDGNHDFSNLFYFCDREFYKFDVRDKVLDFMDGHESRGNLFWTIGHSFENYFFNESLMIEAFRFLTGSEFKYEALRIFSGCFVDAVKVVATITLAARDIGKSSYPLGVVFWKDFEFVDGNLVFDMSSWRGADKTEICENFKSAYEKYESIVNNTDYEVLLRVCRGHTGLQLLQRVFARCLYESGSTVDASLATKHSDSFAKIKENSVSSALCESWIRTIGKGNLNYPSALIDSIA